MFTDDMDNKLFLSIFKSLLSFFSKQQMSYLVLNISFVVLNVRYKFNCYSLFSLIISCIIPKTELKFSKLTLLKGSVLS
ncbi:hypothetical protein COL30_29160 [Bacillus pseudomycoides]|nr:hypothetical protein CON79_17840 [Bacillus pseudomycoides]PFW68969.1 hypothetical protein COL30_29160 [Bacillus pseudomycoides]PHB20016.1 hypothetical protein COE85_14230 [Bacillus pseudomycoides]